MGIEVSRVFVVLALIGALHVTPSSAQQDDGPDWRGQAMAHVGHVADEFNGTPEGRGLLPTARAEAEIVVRHAELAARDTMNLESMQTHAGHVLHAVDPGLMPQGPGLGYGLKRAAEASEVHMSFIEELDGAPWAVDTYAGHVEDSCENTADRADEIIEAAQEIRLADDVSDAQPHVRELLELTDALINGVDANNDGGVGARRGEGGLVQAEQNLATLRKELAETEMRGSR